MPLALCREPVWRQNNPQPARFGRDPQLNMNAYKQADKVKYNTHKGPRLKINNSPVFWGEDDRETFSCQLYFFPKELLFNVSWRERGRTVVGQYQRDRGELSQRWSRGVMDGTAGWTVKALVTETQLTLFYSSQRSILLSHTLSLSSDTHTHTHTLS